MSLAPERGLRGGHQRHGWQHIAETLQKMPWSQPSRLFASNESSPVQETAPLGKGEHCLTTIMRPAAD
jgi:hypothetical protein